MMKLLFTKSKAPMSVLIRWALNEPCSHFAVSFDDKIVFHSNLLGVQLNGFTRFTKGLQVVHCLDYSGRLTLKEEESIYQAIEINEGKWYDFSGLIYFTWRAFLLKAFKLPLPKRNLFGSKGSFLCSELAEALPSHVLTLDADLAITSPQQVFEALKKNYIKLPASDMAA